MLKTDDGVELYKDDEKAEHLSRFFQSVFTREVAVPTDHCNVDNVPTIDSVVLTKPIVQQELLKLKEGTSPGPDEIPAKLLKELATELAEPLSVLFQASLDAGRLPPEWKAAWISPIHKNGSRASANNYRPVSLTSICCKVMEQIIKRELMRFLEQNHLLCDAQHGFRRGRSCLTNLLYCLEQWTRAIDEGNVVHVAYIDFKKAFDSVPHQRLLHKLSRIGVRGKLLKWIENFLVGRSQTVRLGGQHSAEVTVTSGIPQGSVLGPILFLIYIDDCIHGLDCKIAMFADDIKLWTVIRNEDDEANLQANLDRLEKWVSIVEVLPYKHRNLFWLIRVTRLASNSTVLNITRSMKNESDGTQQSLGLDKPGALEGQGELKKDVQSGSCVFSHLETMTIPNCALEATEGLTGFRDPVGDFSPTEHKAEDVQGRHPADATVRSGDLDGVHEAGTSTKPLPPQLSPPHPEAELAGPHPRHRSAGTDGNSEQLLHVETNAAALERPSGAHGRRATTQTTLLRRRRDGFSSSRRPNSPLQRYSEVLPEAPAH
nr:unnamed protein product [Spirometra erinaceieuropaei]